MKTALLLTIGLIVAYIISAQYLGQQMLRQIVPVGWDYAETKSMKEVVLWVEDEETGERLTLKIPKAYLSSKENLRGGKQEHIRIDINYDTLEPWSLQEDNQRLIPQEQGADHVNIRIFELIISSGKIKDFRNLEILRVHHVPKEIEKNIWVYKDTFDHEKNLKKYDNKFLKNGTRIFLSKQPRIKGYSGACPSVLRCQMHFNSHNKGIMAAFHADRILQWEEIIKKTNQLIAKFKVNEAN